MGSTGNSVVGGGGPQGHGGRASTVQQTTGSNSIPLKSGLRKARRACCSQHWSVRLGTEDQT
eukprot:2656990-Amphidinium_carterae.1